MKYESATKISGSTSAFMWDTRHQPIAQLRAVIFHKNWKLRYTASETSKPACSILIHLPSKLHNLSK